MKNRIYWLTLMIVFPLLLQAIPSAKAMEEDEITHTTPIGKLAHHASQSAEFLEIDNKKLHSPSKNEDEISASHVVILGGGVGGVVAANSLRELLPEQFKITVIDRSPYQLLGLTLLGLMTGDRETQNIIKPLSLLRSKGIEFVEGVVTEINP